MSYCTVQLKLCHYGAYGQELIRRRRTRCLLHSQLIEILATVLNLRGGKGATPKDNIYLFVLSPPSTIRSQTDM
jgi:hypothetical protein